MRRKLIWVCLFTALAVSAVVSGERVFATPASGFEATTLALGRFGDIAVSNSTLREGDGEFWKSCQKTHGPSDLYVQNNLFAPGASSGWHTHPGYSLIIVTAGTLTAYDKDDPGCVPHVYTEGMGFVDRGGDHVHMLRNETSTEARTIAVQLIPAGATRRIDADGPAECPL
jgi:hypothetical protein